MWWFPWLIGGMMVIGSWLLEDEAVVEINKILNDKGKVKFHDKKTQVYGIEIYNGYSFKDLQDLKGKIENFLKYEVEIVNENFRYFIRPIVEKDIPTLVPFEIINTQELAGLKVAVAKSDEGNIFLDFYKVPHTLVAGATGWGKSIFTKNLILQIISNFPHCELELFDFKAGIELGDFKNLRQTKSFIIRPDQAVLEMTRIYEEIEYRFDEVTSHGERDWIAFNQKNSEPMTPKFVIIEEFTILLDQDKELSTVLTKCLAIARAVGVFFIFTSQRFDSKIIDSKIKANIDNRICFHTSDAINSKLILDTTGAERLETVGRCLISVAGAIQEGQSFYVKENDVQNTIKSHFKPHTEVLEDKVNKYKDKNKKSPQGQEIRENEGEFIWVSRQEI